MAVLPQSWDLAGHCPGVFRQALLTSRSGLWGFISSTAWPLLTSMTWESPSQATCSIFPRMKVTTPVVPQRRLWKKIHFHFKAFSYLTQGQNTLKLQCRACSQGGTGSAFPTAATAHQQPLGATLAEHKCAHDILAWDLPARSWALLGLLLLLPGTPVCW